MRLLGQAAVLFAVTNIDDLVVLALFFARAGADRGAALRVVAGQYLGFAAILAFSGAGALGAGLLPPLLIPYLGLVPLLLGLRAAWAVIRRRDDVGETMTTDGAGSMAVAGVTAANGGDNVGVYVPAFAATDARGVGVYLVVFLLGVGLWCAAGRYLATRPVIAGALARYRHVVLPVVLIGLGLLILLEGPI